MSAAYDQRSSGSPEEGGGELRPGRASLGELRTRRRSGTDLASIDEAVGGDTGPRGEQRRLSNSARRPLRVSNFSGELGGELGGSAPQMAASDGKLDPAAGAGAEDGAPGTKDRPRFNKDAVLDTDMDLIKQLTRKTDDLRQRMGREGRVNPLGRPRPPPKVTPYRGLRGGATGASTQVEEAKEKEKEQQPGIIIGGPHEGDAGGGDGQEEKEPTTPVTGSTTVCGSACSSRPTTSSAMAPGEPEEPTTSDRAAAGEPARKELESSSRLSGVRRMGPVVPKAGTLFSAGDIDNIMDQMMPGAPAASAAEGTTPQGSQTRCEESGRAQAAAGKLEKASSAYLAQELMEELGLPHEEPAPVAAGGGRTAAPPEPKPRQEQQPEVKRGGVVDDEFMVPDRKDLRAQIASIDSLLVGDFRDRDCMAEEQRLRQEMIRNPDLPQPTSMLLNRDPMEPRRDNFFLDGGDAGEGQDEREVFSVLEDFKRAKSRGQQQQGGDQARLKLIAQKAKGLAPRMSLEGLVRMLKLFASARYAEPDLYLRILGEVPMQIRQVTPELLVRAVGVLRRLRMRESTYVELFASEAMNMIRGASRRRVVSKPRLPSARLARAAAGCAGGDAAQEEQPAAAVPGEVGPFSPLQLVKLGNGFCLLDAKHQPRFVEVLQDQLQKAIPRLSREECEMVHPCLALSALMNDPLRRLLLERCAVVGAGILESGKLGALGNPTQATPDIPSYRAAEAAQRQRMRHIQNVYALEASVRKESFSFYSSLPAEVRSYLKGLEEGAGRLPTDEPSRFTLQVAEILGQLGVQYSLDRKAGPIQLHIVAQATNPYNGEKERVYECDDMDGYYARKEGEVEEPQMMAATKFRHRLLDRMGTHLTRISTWEWQKMGEAQRVNYIVKLHSLK